MRVATISAALALASSSLGCVAPLDLEETRTESAEILGGTNVPAGKWPELAGIVFGGDSIECTGTLVAPTVVVTAAHCIEDFGPPASHVLLAATSLARQEEGERIAVTARHAYPGGLDSIDIAVLVLATPSQQAPRAIATGWARPEIRDGAEVVIAGYGAIDRDGEEFIDDLQEAVTTITDFDCSRSAGCNSIARPAGELGAGGMGIDTCAGDSGGPLYVATAYGAYLAGVTSRGYDDNRYYCSEGGIYGRPDKIVDWIEQQTGVTVARAPGPAYDARISAVRGYPAETAIVPNDPKPTTHAFTIKTPPRYGQAAVSARGQLRVCTDPGVVGDDSLVVNVADAADPARNLDLAIQIVVEDGAPGADCSPTDFGGDDGGCCDAGRGAGGSIPLALAVLGVIARRRRGR